MLNLFMWSTGWKFQPAAAVSWKQLNSLPVYCYIRCLFVWLVTPPFLDRGRESISWQEKTHDWPRRTEGTHTALTRHMAQHKTLGCPAGTQDTAPGYWAPSSAMFLSVYKKWTLPSQCLTDSAIISLWGYQWSTKLSSVHWGTCVLWHVGGYLTIAFVRLVMVKS